MSATLPLTSPSQRLGGLVLEDVQPHRRVGGLQRAGHGQQGVAGGRRECRDPHCAGGGEADLAPDGLDQSVGRLLASAASCWETWPGRRPPRRRSRSSMRPSPPMASHSGGYRTTATTATIDAQLIAVSARIAGSARGLRLHSPQRWPWENPWQALFNAAAGP